MFRIYFFSCLYIVSSLHHLCAQKLDILEQRPWVAHPDSAARILDNIKHVLEKSHGEESGAFSIALIKKAKAKEKQKIVFEAYKLQSSYLLDHPSKSNETIHSIEEQLLYAERSQNFLEIGLAYLNLGQVLRGMGKPEKALRNMLKGLDVLQKHNENKGLYQAYSNLGNFYCFTEPAKARTYTEKALALQKYTQDPRSIISNINTIALSYQQEQNKTKAIETYEIALQEAVKYKDNEWQGIISGNMAMIYVQEKAYEKALQYIFKDLQASKDLGNTTNALLGVADIYLLKQQPETAKTYIDSAMAIAQKVKKAALFVVVYQRYWKYYKTVKNFEKALLHFQNLIHYRDTIQQQAQATQIKQVQSQYDFDKQEEQIALLKDKDRLQEQNIKQQRIINYSAIAVGMILVGFIYFLFRNNQKTRKLNQALQIQKEEILTQNEEILTQNEELQQNQEEILTQRDFIEKQHSDLNIQNRQIQNSIKSALTIQTAVLPTYSYLNQLFENYFVLYQPKDIVSGDFYWIERIEHQTFVIVADCTGHGVPGAFMSLIASNILEKVIFQQQTTDPAEMLNLMHQMVVKSLHQKENNDVTGLDMAIAVLENQEDATQITFVGAKRPLYYVDAQQPKAITTLRGTRKSLGGYQNEDVQFQNQTIVLSKNSRFYIGSDGFADQNNVQRKRLGEMALCDHLLAIQDMDMKVQKNSLIALLQTHMKNTTQRDDILLIGIQL